MRASMRSVSPGPGTKACLPLEVRRAELKLLVAALAVMWICSAPPETVAALAA